MDSRNYNRIWLVILATILLTGCAMWSVPMEQISVGTDITALGLMAIGGVSFAVWLITEPRAVLGAVAFPILARLERRRVKRSPFWRRGRCSHEELKRCILPLLRYCGISEVERCGIHVCSISLPDALSPG